LIAADVYGSNLGFPVCPHLKCGSLASRLIDKKREMFHSFFNIENKIKSFPFLQNPPFKHYFLWLMKFLYFLQWGRQWIMGFMVYAFARAGNGTEDLMCIWHCLMEIFTICFVLFLQADVVCQKVITRFLHYRGNISFLTVLLNLIFLLL
jgi:hypothetical protein